MRFSGDHALGVLLVLAECLAAAWIVNRAPRAGARVLCAAILAYVVQAYANRWAHLTASEVLPLHLCDVVIVLSFFVCLQVARGRPPAALGIELTYYWGLGLSIFALITPDLYIGFPRAWTLEAFAEHWRFFEFFLGHGLIFAAATFLLRGWGITSRPPFRAILWLLNYTVVVGALDLAFGWNYGYLRAKPVAGSLLDVLGPWPTYVGVVLLLSVAQFFLLWVPVRIYFRFARGTRG